MCATVPKMSSITLGDKGDPFKQRSRIVFVLFMTLFFVAFHNTDIIYIAQDDSLLKHHTF